MHSFTRILDKDKRTMLTALDHVIIGVKNLEQVTQTFSEKSGLAVNGGGNHQESGTANRIIVSRMDLAS